MKTKLKELMKLWMVGALLLPMVACSGSGDSPELPDEVPEVKDLIDPCSLISKSEVEEVLQVKVGEAEKNKGIPENHPLGMRTCGYYPIQDNPTEVMTRMFQVTIVQDEGISAELRQNGQTAALLFENSRTDKAVDLNLGDDSYLLHAGYLNMLKKGIFITVMTSVLPPEENDYDLALAASQEFASRISDRL